MAICIMHFSILQINVAEKRLGRVKALKEEVQRDSTNEESEGQQEEEVEGNDGEPDPGVLSKVSLLDQHSELKKKAEGRNLCIVSKENTSSYHAQGSKLAHVRKSETSKISGGLVKILDH
jgi:hypothetical protein